MPDAVRCAGRVTANAKVSSGLIRLDLELEMPTTFAPGQFAMLNLLPEAAAFVFGRPFSIFMADDHHVSFLYRVVGRGTAALAEAAPGAQLSYLGPLGRPFPEPVAQRPVMLLGGGVGLPPVWAWFERWGREGDIACFGARDGLDVPWSLLDERWAVSVDDPEDVPADRTAWHGLVTTLGEDRLAGTDRAGMILACGPLPLLRAAAELARRAGWEGWLSLEEHMGCGYGVCKGCVVPVLAPVPPDGDGPGWRNATCCDEGPVFRAETIAWERYGPDPRPLSPGPLAGGTP